MGLLPHLFDKNGNPIYKKSIIQQNWGRIILDESHNYRNIKSK